MNIVIYTIDGGIAFLHINQHKLSEFMDELNLFPKPLIKATNGDGKEVLINTRNISAIEEDN